jgi:nitrite reductase/ring-hydroxylating ferredoxin subunit
VQAGGQSIAILDVGGSYYAIENTRPHRGGPLSECTIAGDEGRSKSFGIPLGARARCLKRQGSSSE